MPFLPRNSASENTYLTKRTQVREVHASKPPRMQQKALSHWKPAQTNSNGESKAT